MCSYNRIECNSYNFLNAILNFKGLFLELRLQVPIFYKYLPTNFNGYDNYSKRKHTNWLDQCKSYFYNLLKTKSDRW